MSPRFHQFFGIVATGIVLVAFVWGLLIVGSPITGRRHRFDERRLEDLRTISNEISMYVYEGKMGDPNAKPARPVPVSLEQAAANVQYHRLNLIDPETGAPYGYRVIDSARYDLCATFAFARTQQYDIFWDHPDGRHCYSFDVRYIDGQSRPAKDAPPVSPVEPG
ncbi:MAG: hypothetical protein Greene041619_175 [Candidatus Peregrinibacteria bacterium Greene0416_19]|nr:MAG: hypothetical protein Greene041619_175 [Candidatus Peregrinibacteria bacterium Greene0416_19]